MAAVTVGPVENAPPLKKRGPSSTRPSRTTFSPIAFLVPGAIWLLAIVIYPAIVTIKDSFFNETDTKAVGLTNYKDLFTTAETLIALRNNVIWVIVFPFVVTTIGLVLAVLTERIRWATAFKTVIFLPVVFSVTASSMVFAQIFDVNPHVGVVNALIQIVEDVFNPPGAYPLQPGQTAGSLASAGAVAGPHGTVQSAAGGTSGRAW